MKNNQRSAISEQIRFMSIILIVLYVLMAIIIPFIFIYKVILGIGYVLASTPGGRFSDGHSGSQLLLLPILQEIFPVDGGWVFVILMSLYSIFVAVGIFKLLKLRRTGLYILAILLAITLPWLFSGMFLIALIQIFILTTFILYFYKKIKM